MELSDSELRALVQQSISRLRRLEPPAASGPDGPHASHVLLPLAKGGDGDGACLIEPAVRCNHCGYCISYGH